MISRLLCLVGVHCWWYGDSRTVRVCSTCPAKQKLVDGRWRRAS